MDEGDKKVDIRDEWKVLLHDEFEKFYFKDLYARVRVAYLKETVFPSPQNMFRAFDECLPQNMRVVILGQDPYHTPGVADGLAFSSVDTNPIPPSLRNMYKEIALEYGTPLRITPDLSDWAKQGVLLLNASLTVESGRANSHREFGWHEFTDVVISTISRECEHVVFMLWGNYAREKRSLIDTTKHLVLESSHPSPLSAHKGFLGNGHFKYANEYLEKNGRGIIHWG